MIHGPFGYPSHHRPDAITSVAQAQALLALHQRAARRQSLVALAIALAAASTIVGSVLALVLVS